MGIHGGLNETSVFMHLRPGQVDLAVAERRVPEALAENDHVRFGGSVSFGWLSNDFHPDGYIGDPTGATPELGKQLFDHAVGTLAEAMAEVKAFDFGPLNPTRRCHAGVAPTCRGQRRGRTSSANRVTCSSIAS